MVPSHDFFSGGGWDGKIKLSWGMRPQTFPGSLGSGLRRLHFIKPAYNHNLSNAKGRANRSGGGGVAPDILKLDFSVAAQIAAQWLLSLSIRISVFQWFKWTDIETA
jgi:hypothetical protein